MTVENNNTRFEVTDAGQFWKIETVSGKLSVCYKLSKADYPDAESVKAFILNELKGGI